MPIASTAFVGNAVRAQDRHSRWPGTARSREKANIIRDAEVTEAETQKSCAVHGAQARGTQPSGVPHRLLPDVDDGVRDGVEECPATSGTANVTATSRMNPNTTEATTDMTMPIAAERDAWRVSSLMCADAS